MTQAYTGQHVGLLRKKPHCFSIDEFDSFQVENDGLIMVLFQKTFSSPRFSFLWMARAIVASVGATFELKRRWTKPLRGRPEGRSPAIGDLAALISQLSFL
jgi:hypothetical protein